MMPDAERDYHFRQAALSDAAIVARQRAAMFRDMGVISSKESVLLRHASEPWIADLMARNKYMGWFLEYQAAPVTGGGVLLLDRGPVPGCYRIGRWAHIVNIYT